MENLVQTPERNYGIDLLRIVSMIMIVLLHVLGNGEIISSTEPCSIRYYMLWLLEVAAYCGVNCYGLISGYIGISHKWKPANLIKLWLQVLFYTSLMCLLFKAITPEAIGLKMLIKSFIPLYSSAYWYFSAYFCMFFFIPFLNGVIHRLNKRSATALIVALIFFFSIYTTVYPDIWITSGGYTALWLSVLYLIGAYLKKYEILYNVKKRVFVFLYLSGVLISWGFRFFAETVFPRLSSQSGRLITYTSPTILLCGIALLLLFSSFHVKGICQKAVRFFAPASFGVYLIHWNKCVRGYYVAAFSRFAAYPVLLIPILVLAFAVIIWFLASLIDKVRIMLFKAARINTFADFLGEKLKITAERFIKKIEARF